MAINLTLNDFRGVLGIKNDGDVVMRLDQKGIEKANWGGLFSGIFNTVRRVTPSASENMAMRRALLAAVMNSAEGKVLSEADMRNIESAVGISEGIIDEKKFTSPLSRRELKTVIDIIDRATEGGALADKNVASLKEKGLYNGNVANGVKKAMDEAACLKPSANVKAGVAAARAFFGEDFKGRSPAEMEKFVRLNIAVIREQVFDRLYWSEPSLKSVAEPVDLNNAQVFDVDEELDAKIPAKAVSDAFKEVVGSLMEKFAAGERVATRVEMIAADSKNVAFIDKNAENVWDTLINKDGKLDSVVDSVFYTTPEESGTFAAVQLDKASQAVKAMLRDTFNKLFVENGSNSQKTETAFAEKTAPLFAILNGVAADIKAMKPETAGKFLANIADELGRLVGDKDRASCKGWLADAAMKALDNVAKDISPYSIVESFVAERFAYVPDKKDVVDFFLSRIRSEGGITTAQRTALADYQNAALDGKMNNTVSQNLRTLLLTPLATAYTDAEAMKSPEKVKEARQARNASAFASLIAVKDPAYATKDEKGKAGALVKFKVEVLIAKYGHEEVWKMGISNGSGSESIKLAGTDPDVEALKRLDEQLLKLDDMEFEFLSQYCAKGMRVADNELSGNSGLYMNESHESIFQDALKDGTISISSVPAAAVPMLNKLIQAHMFAIAKVNGMEEYVHSLSVRSILPDDMHSGPIAKAMMVRLSERVTSAGLKRVPEGCGMPKAGETDHDCGNRLDAVAKIGYGMIRGFGTLDLGRILKLMGDMGIDIGVLGGNDEKAKVDVYEKVLCLSTLAAMSSYKLDGLAEFAERITGKQFKDVDYSDVLKALQNAKMIDNEGVMFDNTVVPDPIDKLAGDQKTLKELFAGEQALSGVGLAADEAASLLATARDLAAAAPGTVKSASVKLKGMDVELTRLAGGELSVKVGGMPMRAAFDTHGLVRSLENEITSKPGSFAADVVKSTLPSIESVKSGAVPLVRARELYAKTAAAKLNTLPVMFSSYTTEELRDIAVKAVDGKFTVANLPKDPPATYNSGAMLEMHANLSLTSAADVDAKVKIAAPPTRDINVRRTVEPDQQTVRNVVADLFLNKDTWEFDAGKAPGERIRKLLVENGPEISFILKNVGNENMGLLSHLPPEVRNAVKDVFEDIAKIDISALMDPGAVEQGVRNALAAIEAKVGSVADTVIDAMQAKVTQLFSQVGNAQEAKLDWQKSFAELTGKEGIDVNTKQGKFTMAVLNSYFKNSAGVDKRAMLSAFIRNTDDKSSDAKQVAELLKGAGPLLQKMLQGLPLSSFNAETQLALKDMKSRLLPIPDEAVKAQMLELVNSSNGNILSIEVKRSLGAATVGQAFLCTIKTKAHPFAGEECVVKLLRPNVDTAIQREKALIDQIVANDPAMKETFDGQYRKILEEFDLTLESTNVGIGTKIYEQPGGVKTLHSMQMLDGTTSTMTSMIVKKADGSTFDSVVEKARADMKEILRPYTNTTEVNGVRKTVYKAPNTTEMSFARRTLLSKAAQLNDRRNHILNVTQAWFENALFGNGFFHGDLHGGNLMTGTSGTTFIDFGNCSRLSKAEQDAITMMLATTVSGDVSHVIGNFKKLLPPDAQQSFDAKFAENSKARADLEAVLKRGNAYDLMSRLQAFIAAVQGADVQIPPAIQNFVQSYMRLADIVSDIDHAVEDLQIAAASIYCDAPDIAPVEGEPQLFANYKAIARAYVGDANTPFSADAVMQAINAAKEHVKSEAGKAEIRNLMRDENGNLSLQKFLDVVYPFARKMEDAVKCCERDSLVPKMSEVGRYSSVGHIIQAAEGIERVQRGENTYGHTIESYLEDAEDKLGDFFMNAVEYFVGTMLLERGGSSTFNGVAAKRDSSMTDICCEVIKKYQGPLGDAAGVEFGGFLGKAGFALRLGSEFTKADTAAARRKNVGTAIVKKNGELLPGERLSGQDLAALMRATDTFFVPSPRPDGSSGWAKSNANSTSLLEAIYYNLQRGADALKVTVDKMSDAAVSLAALNFGLADGKLAESIQSLSQNDYDALLLVAGQIEMNDVNKPLTTALDALRKSKDMLTQVSKE